MAVATSTLVYAAVAAATIGYSASASHQQRKAAKSAAHGADKRQKELLKQAREAEAAQEKKESNEMKRATSRARQRALAASASKSGRRGTIAAGTLAGAPTAQKSITGG